MSKAVAEIVGQNTSVYLKAEQLKILDDLASSTGRSRSAVMRELLESTKKSTNTKVTKLVGELADLLELR